MEVFNDPIIKVFFESVSEGILVINKKREIVYVNNTIEIIFGYSREELMHKKMELLIPEKFKISHKRDVEKYILQPEKKRMSDRSDIFGAHRNGKTIPLEIGLNYFEYDKERYTIATISEISKDRRANIFLKDLHDVISKQDVIFNEKISLFLKLGCEQFNLPVGILSQVQGDDYEIMGINAPKVFEETILREAPFHVDHTYCYDVLHSDSPIFIDDVSTVKRHTHPCYETLNLEAFIGIKVMVDEQIFGTLNFSSPAPCNVHVFKVDLEILKLMARWIGNLIKQEELIQRLRQFRIDLEKKVELRTFELSHALKEIQDINLNLKDEVRRRKEAEKEARTALEREQELNLLKSRFVSIASHEFRTPLTGILSSVTLIEKYSELGLEEKKEKHLNLIKTSVKNLTDILNDFLSLDKLESGVIKCSPSEFDLKKLIEAIIEELNPILKKKQRIQLEMISDNKITLFQDKKLLKNILTNLISNASKYSDELQPINIIIQSINNDVLIAISDRGIGIPKEDQIHLFERFFRAHNVSSLQGTGLGLNIARKHAKLMNGDITFKSKIEEGSTFTIKIPKYFEQ